jgi:ribosome-associated protein
MTLDNYLEIEIDPTDIRIEYVRSSGPGGQNVNKVATAAQLRFDVVHSRSLAPEVRERLIRIAGKRVNAAGEIVIDARRYRTQQQNREDAMARLKRLIGKASVPPKVRRKSAPPPSSNLRRLDEKKHRAGVKKLRGRPDIDNSF